jgi:hypothetical protein
MPRSYAMLMLGANKLKLVNGDARIYAQCITNSYSD